MNLLPVNPTQLKQDLHSILFQGIWKAPAEKFHNTWGTQKGEKIRQEYIDVFEQFAPKIEDLPESIHIEASPFRYSSKDRAKREAIFISGFFKGQGFPPLFHEALYKGVRENRADFIRRAIYQARAWAREHEFQ